MKIVSILLLILFLTGCNNDGAVDQLVGVSSTATDAPATSQKSDLSISPASYDFGSVEVGNSGEKEFSLTNSSRLPITLDSVGITGSNALSVSQSTCGAVLAPSETCKITVSFQPYTTSPVFSSLTFNYNSKQSVSIFLSGNPNSTNEAVSLTLSPSSYDFGTVAVGSSDSKEFTLTNPSRLTIPVDTSRIIGSTAFSISASTCGVSLSSFSSCKITVTFTPPTSSAVLSLLSLDYNSKQNAMSFLSGNTSQNNESSVLALNPSAYDFGAVTLNTSDTKEIVVSNAGNVPLTIGTINLVGDQSFTISNNTCGSTLNIASTCIVTVQFVPVSSTTSTTLLMFNYNNGSQKALSLLGRGGSSLVFNGLDSVNNVGATSAKLNWSQATGGSVSAYQVQRQLPNGTWSVLATVSNTTTFYVNTGLQPATNYSWRVYAIDAYGVPDGNLTVKSAATSVVAFDRIDPSRLTVVENGTLTANLSCSDTKGSTPAYSLVSQSDTDVGCYLTGNLLTCKPVIKSNHITWTSEVSLRCVIDGVTLQNTETVSVTDSTRPPVLTVPTSRTFPTQYPVGTDLSLSSSATDPDGDTITYSCMVESLTLNSADPNYKAPGSPCNTLRAIQDTTAVFNTSTGVMTWTPSNTQFATYRFTVTASDGYGGSDSKSFDITVAEPPPRSTTLTGYFDALFATGTGPAVTTQPTTWTNLTNSGFNGTIVGSEDNVSGHWKGNGTYSNPYHLSLDGVNDRVELSASQFFPTSSNVNYYHAIRFRIPSSASDGAHPIVTVKNFGVISVIKGSGANYISYTHFSTGTVWNQGGTFVYDRWYVLYFRNPTSFTGNLNIHGGAPTGFINSSYTTASNGSGQAGVDATKSYLGFKPSEAGPGSGPFAQGTAVYGKVDIISYKVFNRDITSSPEYDRVQDNYYFHERIKEFPLGDTRLPSMTMGFDAASSSVFGYRPSDSSTQCTSGSWYAHHTGSSTSLNYTFWDNFLSMGHFVNPGCLSATNGYRGSGSALDPYRWAFDGTPSTGLWYSDGYTNVVNQGGNGSLNDRQLFDRSTKKNSFDFWTRIGSTGNGTPSSYASLPAGLGNHLLALDSTSGVKFGLHVLNLGDGTSELQLRALSNEGVTMSRVETSIGIRLVNRAWYHIAGTISDTGVLKIHVNGQVRYTTTLAENPLCEVSTCGKPRFGGISWTATSADYALFRSYAGHELTEQQVIYNCNHGKARFQGAVCASP